jgi:hypothetical protein
VRAIAVVAAAFLLLGVVFTQASMQNTPPGQLKKAYVGTREIVIDQATGKARKPTYEETQQLVATLSTLTNRSSEGLTVETRADGVKMVDLQGRFGSVTLARPREDGTMEVRCVTSFEEGAAFLGLEELTQ